MAHSTLTYTIIGSFKGSHFDNLYRDLREVRSQEEARVAAHGGLINLLSKQLARWLKELGEDTVENPGADNAGFTIHASHGGGGRWPVEPGFTVILSGLGPDSSRWVKTLAARIRNEEDQSAIVLLVRNESFSLV